MRIVNPIDESIPVETLIKGLPRLSTWTIFKQFWGRGMGKVVTIIALLFSIIGLAVLIYITSLVVEKAQARELYRQDMANAKADPNFIQLSEQNSNVKFVDREVAHRLVDGFFDKIDTLGFTPNLEGLYMNLDLRPPDFLGTTPRRISTCNFFVDCNCGSGIHDIITLSANPHTMQTVMTRKDPAVTAEVYETTYHPKGGEK